MTKVITAILFFVCALGVNGQTLNRGYLKKWITQCDSTARVDLVKAYIINNQYYDLTVDTFAFHDIISSIKISKVQSIIYSKVKQDDFVPGEGFIAIRTIQRKSYEIAAAWLTQAKKVFQDTYTSPSQPINQGAKDPVLVIDNKIISHTLAKETLAKLTPYDIYDISVNNFFPVPKTQYGQNAKNGMVQIWTRKNYKE
jgi:hypothetical protein